MILESIKLFKYSLPLNKPLQLKTAEIEKRDGYIIELISVSGIKSYSEIAPLLNFSKETMFDIYKEVLFFKKEFLQNKIPPDILTKLKYYTPSVRFGIESAFLQLTAQSKELTLIDLLNPNANHTISINALLTGSSDEIKQKAKELSQNGYTAFKIKVGRLPLSEEIETVHEVRKIIGEKSLIRLDANRAFDSETAIEFYEKIQEADIDYIEEPFHTLAILKSYINNSSCEIPLALDESLVEIEVEDLNNMYALKAIVLKPTLLGYTDTMMLAKKAFALGIQPVISSSFETSIGSYILASMGAIIDTTIPIGLDTLSWFKKDIVTDPIIFPNGKLNLDLYMNLQNQIEFTKLEEVPLGNE